MTEAAKIVRLSAENVKRLVAVDITPEGDVVTITGRNAQGKSSVLDAIWLALGGGDASRAIKHPIRQGEEEAHATVELSNGIVVTRRWREDGRTSLVVTSDGVSMRRPQEVLDGLVGAVAFDPLRFARANPGTQRDELIHLLGLSEPLRELDAQRQRLYDERLEIGREERKLGEVPYVDPKMPTGEISAADILARIQASQEVQLQIERDIAAQERARTLVEDAEREVARMEAELAEARARLARHRREAARWDGPTMDTPEPIEPLREELAVIEQTNAAIRANVQASETAAEIGRLRGEWRDRTDQIDRIDEQKLTLVAGADLPVPGLGIDGEGVTLDGVPFSQASSAEQIRVSLAMAMAASPTLRIVQIKDGSLLDSDSLSLIAEMAAERDYQVWIETVGDDNPAAVVIEDGAVAAA